MSSNPDRPFPRIPAGPLVLRQFAPAEGPAVERYVSMREVVDTTLTIPHPYPTGAAALWIGTHQESWNDESTLTLAVCEVALPDDPIGAISLKFDMQHSSAELGYWIAPHLWGRG